MKEPKVFCIGFQKTGTTSLNAALTALGYRVASWWGNELPIGELRRVYVERGFAMLHTHDAVEDMPWPLMFRELDAAYPGARFILTWRESDRWIRSICEHFGDHPGSLQRLTYGDDAPAPVGHEAHYIAIYERHNAEVREYFRDRPNDLLEMNLSHGDGWEKLAPFLGAPVPDRPFPRANSVQERGTLTARIFRIPVRLRRRIRRNLRKIFSLDYNAQSADL